MANKVINPDAAKAFRQKKLSIRKKLNQMKKDGLITGREFISRINQLSQVKLGGTFPASLTAATKTTKSSTTKAAVGNKTVNIATPKPRPKAKQNFRADTSNKTKAKAKSYKIKSGDTLSQIAKDYGTTVATLKKLNDIKDVNKIYAGRSLKLPGDSKASSKKAVPTPKPRPKMYNLKSGKKGTAAQRLKEIEAEKLHEKIKKMTGK